MTSQPSIDTENSFSLASQPSSDSKVEKNKACQKALGEHYPETCLMGDVLHVLAHKRETKKDCLKKRKLAQAFDCVVHENRCPSFILWLFDIMSVLSLLRLNQP